MFFGLNFALLQRSLYHNSIWSKKHSIQVIVLSVLDAFYLDVYFYLLVRVRVIILYVSSPNKIHNIITVTILYPHNINTVSKIIVLTLFSQNNNVITKSLLGFHMQTIVVQVTY